MTKIKNFDVEFKKIKKEIPNITVLALALKNRLPSYYEDITNVIELSNLNKHTREWTEFKSFKEGEKYEYNKLKEENKERIVRLNNHFRALDCKYRVEVPYHDILRKVMYFHKSILPFDEFIDLIKYITFFHQNKREWYEDKNIGKKYLLAHYNDFIYAYQIALHLFSTPSPNLKPVKLKFFNYLVDEAEKKIKREGLKNLSIYDIQLEQSKIITNYQGKASTLRLWLSQFSSSLGILSRSQRMKNAKIYYSLKKIAPLKSNKFTSFIKDIQNINIQ